MGWFPKAESSLRGPCSLSMGSFWWCLHISIILLSLWHMIMYLHLSICLDAPDRHHSSMSLRLLAPKCSLPHALIRSISMHSQHSTSTAWQKLWKGFGRYILTTQLCNGRGKVADKKRGLIAQKLIESWNSWKLENKLFYGCVDRFVKSSWLMTVLIHGSPAIVEIPGQIFPCSLRSYNVACEPREYETISVKVSVPRRWQSSSRPPVSKSGVRTPAN